MKIEVQHNQCVSKQAKWDKRFIELCDHIAAWSEDRSRKVGAVIVGSDKSVLSVGYNGLPRGISDAPPERHSREDQSKYFWFEHAERNAIYNAARNGTALGGASIYVSLFPCADCARAIIQSGLLELVTRSMPDDEVSFAESMAVSHKLIEESHLVVRYI